VKERKAKRLMGLVRDDPMPEPRPRPRPPIDTAGFTVEFPSGDAPVEFAEIFGTGNPVELEVGSGKGLFLANAAAAQPGNNFVGVELSRKYARSAAERMAKRGLGNVRVIAGDARLFLARHVPPASLRAVHVYFPDPWWKTRHKKRRVFTAALVGDIERALEPQGELWVASDVAEYFGVIRGLVAEHPRFQEVEVPVPKDPEHDLDYLTNFERKYRIEGRPIYRAHYRLELA
jgi:tRNA (guanine-N7-)-methyltransferase